MGGGAADANYARAQVTVRQTQAQIKAIELQIAAEVTNAASQMQSNVKRVGAATAARELAQKRLEAETSKFEVGLSTNFFVVQAQRDLAEAETTELRARLDYEQSHVNFERVQLTSLSRAGISIVSTGTGGTGTGTTTGTGTGTGTGNAGNITSGSATTLIRTGAQP